jgi:hypothetical protein
MGKGQFGGGGGGVAPRTHGRRVSQRKKVFRKIRRKYEKSVLGWDLLLLV